ncbi:hypothetical protein HAX54_051399, partial [Datura stramonium]|nr:hypothetical protein [Datura stramonium]
METSEDRARTNVNQNLKNLGTTLNNGKTPSNYNNSRIQSQAPNLGVGSATEFQLSQVPFNYGLNTNIPGEPSTSCVDGKKSQGIDELSTQLQHFIFTKTQYDQDYPARRASWCTTRPLRRASGCSSVPVRRTVQCT